jgi:hypothetical protein
MTASPPASAPKRLPDSGPRAHEIAVLGNDMVLAALPARPVQLAHAIRACGYDLVVPVSWGEELLAEHALRSLDALGEQPAVFCSCPRVRSRLLQVGPELAPRLVSCVAPPVATARYLRIIQPDATLRITYFGSCEGARDPAIDARVAPLDFLRHLETRSISLARQPTVFESVIPPDRRRHLSLPGGAPCAEQVTANHEPYRLLTLGGHDFAAEIADRLMTRESVLIDVATSLGCFCAGAIPGQQTETAREVVMALEPPRSGLPVIDGVTIDLELPSPEPLPYDRFRLVLEGPGSPMASADAPAWGGRAKEIGRWRSERRRIAVTPPSVQPPLDTPAASGPTEARAPGQAAELVRPVERESALPQSAEPAWPTSSPDVRRAPDAPWPDTAPRVGLEAGATTEAPVRPADDSSSSRRTSPWSVGRIATPPVARSAWGLVPRAYAARRRLAVQRGDGVSPETADETPVAQTPVGGAEEQSAVVTSARPNTATPVPDQASTGPVAIAPLVAPSPESSRRTQETSVPESDQDSITQVTVHAAMGPSPVAETQGATPAGLPIPPPSPIAPVLDMENAYVRVKERVAGRREHARVRRVPPVQESYSDRLWRLLAYVLLIAAIVLATLAVERP